MSATRARFVPKCERGRLELGLALADDGKIAGFGGISYEVPPEPANRKLAEGIVALTNRWSDAGYGQTFGKEFGIPMDDVKAFLAKSHGALGTCKLGAPKGLNDVGQQEWALSCERGAEHALTVQARNGDAKRVGGFTLRPVKGTKCPVR